MDDAAATINFKSAEARRLFEGGVYYAVNGHNSGRGQSKRAQWRARWLDSVVRGHHVYKMEWTQFLGKILTAIKEPENNHERHAVCEERERKRLSLTARAVAHGHTPW